MSRFTMQSTNALSLIMRCILVIITLTSYAFLDLYVTFMVNDNVEIFNYTLI